MSTEMTLPVDSPISGIPTSESATTEENRMSRLQVLEMWEAWINGKDPPKAIPGFPELSPRPTGTSNVPISHPNIPSGQHAICTHSVGGTSGVHLQILMPGTAPNIFTAPLCSAAVQHSLPQPVFDPWVFPFQKPVPPTDPPSSEITTEAPEQDEKNDGHGDPITHLRKYCNRLHGTGGNEELSMDFENGKILSQAAIRATSQAIQGGSGGIAKGKKKREMDMVMSGAREYRNHKPHFSEGTPQYYYSHQDMAYTPQPYMVMNVQPSGRTPQQASRDQPPFQRDQPPRQNRYNSRPPQINFRPREPPKRPNYTPIGESYSTMLPKLVQMNLLQPIPPNRQNPKSPSYQRGVRCAYHSGVEGHDTNDCWTLKIAVEDLIEHGKIVIKDEEVPNMTNNSLPAHNNGPVIGMICEDKEFDPALKAIIAIDDAEKKPKAASKQEKGEKKSKIAETEQEKEIDVPEQASVVRGTIKPLWLNEPVVIGRVPQKPITDPVAISYKGKEILGKLQEMEEMCGAMRKMLHETHIVQSGEGTSTAEVSYTGPSAKLRNWKATPFLIRQESQ